MSYTTLMKKEGKSGQVKSHHEAAWKSVGWVKTNLNLCCRKTDVCQDIYCLATSSGFHGFNFRNAGDTLQFIKTSGAVEKQANNVVESPEWGDDARFSWWFHDVSLKKKKKKRKRKSENDLQGRRKKETFNMCKHGSVSLILFIMLLTFQQ